MNFQDQKLFETEVIKEKVVFKMSAEAHQFVKNSEMFEVRA